MSNTQTNYQNLANAVVIQAARDYRKAVMKLKKYPKNDDALRTKAELEEFFYSDWYSTLININPNYLIMQLEKEI